MPSNRASRDRRKRPVIYLRLHANIGLSANTTYTYTVAADDAAGNTSAPSSSVAATTQATPLSPQVVYSVSGYPPNTVTLHEPMGVAVTNYPLQLGRPFAQGEIPRCPEILADGTPLLTQATVQTRWPDGSAQHVILNVIVPAIPANGTVTLTFRDSVDCHTSGGLTPAQMLAILSTPAPQATADPQMQFTNGGTVLKASARQMLSDGAVIPWLTGPVATSVLLADHSLARKYDIGFDANRSIHPMFVATFWPNAQKVWVRYVSEIANTETLQDQTYDATLFLGGQTIFVKSGLVHGARTRWTKTAWWPQAPAALDIDHKLGYLTTTKLLPNYNAALTLDPAAFLTRYNTWKNAPHGPNDVSLLNPDMGSTDWGRRVGLHPGWVTDWLYSGDHRAQEVAENQAELGGTYVLHYREGKDGRWYDRGQTVSALGKPLSLNARPTFNGKNLTEYATKPADRVTPLGSLTRSVGAWGPDLAHQPELYAVPYMLTGDYYYLEQLHFWASWTATTPVVGNSDNARGPTGIEGGIHDELRGEAAAFRARTYVAVVAPDGSGEKRYFTQLLHDAIVIWEGLRGIKGTQFDGTPLWRWANALPQASSTSYTSPLHFWRQGEGYAASVSRMLQPVNGIYAPWMGSMVACALTLARDMGYPTQGLITWMAPNLIRMVTDADSDPYMIGGYRVASLTSDGTHYQNWGEVLAAYLPGYTPISVLECYSDLESGYFTMGKAALACLANESGGAPAWQWAQGALPFSNQGANPKWAIMPRRASVSPSQALFSTDTQAPTVSQNLTGLSANTTDSYTVAADDAAGNTSALSLSMSATTQAIPPPPPPADTQASTVPQKLTATPVSNSQMKLTWKASTHNVGVQGYKVLRNGSVIATVTVTTFQDSGLTPKTAYTYTVQAFDAAGNTSAQSASVKISTPLGRVLTVGPTRALKLPSQAAAQAHDGDLIAIDAGTYMGDVAIWSADNLTLRGVGGLAKLKANGKSAQGKGIWIIQGNNTTVENMLFSDAVGSISAYGAGLYQTGANLTVRNCVFQDNETGLRSMSDEPSTLRIEFSEFARNGTGDGSSHNINVVKAISFTLLYSYVHHAEGGHQISSHAETNYILYNRIMDETTGAGRYAMHFPDGGLIYIIGNAVQRGSRSTDSRVITYADVSKKSPTQELYVAHNTFVNDGSSSVHFLWVVGTPTADVVNNVFTLPGTALHGQAEMRSNLIVNTPGFVDRAHFDYDLGQNSPAIHGGTVLSKIREFSLLPRTQYAHPAHEETRTDVAQPDIGAFAYQNVGQPILP